MGLSYFGVAAFQPALQHYRAYPMELYPCTVLLHEHLSELEFSPTGKYCLTLTYKWKCVRAYEVNFVVVMAKSYIATSVKKDAITQTSRI